MRNEAERLAIEWGIPIAIAMLAVIVRLLFASDRLTIIGVMRAVIVGLFVGSLSAMYLAEIDTLTPGEKGAIIGVTSVLSEDIVVLLLKFGKTLREDPGKVISTILKIKR